MFKNLSDIFNKGDTPSDKLRKSMGLKPLNKAADSDFGDSEPAPATDRSSLSYVKAGEGKLHAKKDGKVVGSLAKEERKGAQGWTAKHDLSGEVATAHKTMAEGKATLEKMDNKHAKLLGD